jgi:ubiquinol-cytochrome c reductase iron-sulfur subunit
MRMVMEWRGQPIWIVKRTQQMLQILPTLDPVLRDPKSANPDQQPDYVLKGDYHFRSIKPEISVLVGICTHLGCSPEMVAEIRPEPFDPNWKGGYFCPCHKSRYDMSGRVYDGVPAPYNLAVPPHHYENDTTIVIGVDPGSSTSTGAA